MMGQLFDLGDLSKSQLNVAPDQDPAAAIPGMPPAFGQFLMPHVLSFSGSVGSLSKVYRQSDEALMDSWDNARLMRNDLSIMECVEGRQRCVALLNWHLKPDNEKDPVQKEVAQHLTSILNKIPRFMQYRENLLHATFFGKYGVLNRWRWRSIEGKWRIAPDRWRPVHGDKLVFRYDPDTKEWQDDQIGIRVGSHYVANQLVGGRWPVEKARHVSPTSEGMAYFLRAHERSLIAIHKHYIEDGEFEVPHNAGRIHGVGVRSRIYWTWYQKQETLAWLMEYLERSAGGFEIWYYPQGNPTAKEEVYRAARDRLSLGRNVILVPRAMGEPGAQPYDRIEPSMAGAEALKSIVIEYFGHQIKRYILGQTLTTEASNTGLGSNTADVHLATFYTIVEYDAQLLEETLTDDLIGPLMRYNFPWAQFGIRFVIDTKSDDAQAKMQAYQQAWQMGLKLKAADVMALIGSSKPEPGDDVLSIGGQQGGAPSGMPAGTGGPPPANQPPPNDQPDGPQSHQGEPLGDAPEQYARKAASGQLSLFGGPSPKDPQFERQHPRDADGTFRDKNEPAATSTPPQRSAAELKELVIGEKSETREDASQDDELQQRYHEYVLAMQRAKIMPRSWGAWKKTVLEDDVAEQPAEAVAEKSTVDDRESELRQRYDQYAADVKSHGITPRPWEAWRALKATDEEQPKDKEPNVETQPEAADKPLHEFRDEETGMRSTVHRHSASGGFIASLHDDESGETVSAHRIYAHDKESSAVEYARQLVGQGGTTQDSGTDDNSKQQATREPHELSISELKNGALMPPELYDGLHRGDDEKDFVVHVDKKPSGKFDVYLQSKDHPHLRSPYGIDKDADGARDAAWRAAGFNPATRNVIPSRVIENHREAVRRALESGQPVPEHVLADYPELRFKAPEPDSDENASAVTPSEDAAPDDTSVSNPATDNVDIGSAEQETDAADDNPRAAAERHAKALQDGYAYARASAVGNAGEDLAGSARHKVNAWRGLNAAESEGRGEEMVTRDNLLKGDPPDLLRHVTAGTALTGLAMHLAMRAFPKAPYDATHYSMRRSTDDDKKQHRADFVSAYAKIKTTAEDLTQHEPDPMKALAALHAKVTYEIKQLRETSPRKGYDPVANALVDMYRRIVPYADNATSVRAQLLDFTQRLSDAYGQDVNRELLDKAAEHVQDVMEGDSFNKTFGTVQKGGKPAFNPADMYVKHATRKGGRVIDATSVKAGTQFMLDTLKMRGVQYGNYVTDEERQHHLQKSAESFADLADVVGLPDEQASLNGIIGLGIGARGTGRALAHYEPDSKVINLTRTGGVGSLAHEWGHAFDHHIAGGEITSDGEKRGGDYQSQRISPVRIMRDELGGYLTDDTGKLKTEDLTSDPMFKAYKSLRDAWKSSGFDRQVQAGGKHHFGAAWKTKRRYWDSNEEKFARTFERYVQWKLEQDGRENTYLSGKSPAAYHPEHGLWPTDAQVEAMAPAFEAIFSAYRDRLAGKQAATPPSTRQAERYALIYGLNSVTAAATRQWA